MRPILILTVVLYGCWLHAVSPAKENLLSTLNTQVSEMKAQKTFAQRQRVLLRVRAFVLNKNKFTSIQDEVDSSFAANALAIVPEGGFKKSDCEKLKSQLAYEFDPQARGLPYVIEPIYEMLDLTCRGTN